MGNVTDNLMNLRFQLLRTYSSMLNSILQANSPLFVLLLYFTKK
jgi:hypothetical protein